jgi:hypothetical protein
MPATFGAAAKVGVQEIENKVNLDVLSYTPDGKLTSFVSKTLKDNIANYLSNYRMMNDYIVVGSANVIDLSIETSLIVESSVNPGEVVTNVITKISDYFSVDKMEMGKDLSVSALRGDIQKQIGVITVVDLKVYNKVGDGYSESVTSQPYINPSTREIGLVDDTVFAQPDEILQIRMPQKDIVIRVKKPTKPIFT